MIPYSADIMTLSTAPIWRVDIQRSIQWPIPQESRSPEEATLPGFSCFSSCSLFLKRLSAFRNPRLAQPSPAGRQTVQHGPDHHGWDMWQEHHDSHSHGEQNMHHPEHMMARLFERRTQDQIDEYPRLIASRNHKTRQHGAADAFTGQTGGHTERDRTKRHCAHKLHDNAKDDTTVGLSGRKRRSPIILNVSFPGKVLNITCNRMKDMPEVVHKRYEEP